MDVWSFDEDESGSSNIRSMLGVRSYPGFGQERSWAHVSGWMQLRGDPRTVSAVIVANDDVRALREQLPALSDLLTECAHPWEILVVCDGDSDRTESLLAGWCELPGYRAIVFDALLPHGSAVTLGLRAARGDAVVVLDPRSAHPLSLVSQMLMRWELGQPLLYAAQIEGVSEVMWPDDPLRGGGASAPMRLFDERGDLVLLDRTIIRQITR